MSEVLPVMEDFFTLQGEGYYTGRAAYFIRLAGCDVGCHWCDVKDSWHLNSHPFVPVENLVDRVVKSRTDFVVITGGEPCMHDLTLLVSQLKENNITVALETSGSSEITGNFDWICLSPKKFKPPLPSSYARADELKIIIFNKHDLVWAHEQARQTTQDCRLWLQPEWDKKDEMLPIITEYVKLNTRWRLSLQTHKYINIP